MGRLLDNQRKRTAATATFCLILLTAIIASGVWVKTSDIQQDLLCRNTPPTLAHPFGTDFLGRDMLARTLVGLRFSVQLGLLTALIGTLMGCLVGLLAASLGGALDWAATWIMDALLGLPHLVLTILISFSLGGGARGLVIAVALTHWVFVARVVRGEVLSVIHAPYIQTARGFGKSAFWIATRHLFPQVIPQTLVAAVLLFPHVILHESSLSFLGLGLPPHQPSMGILLAESMQYLLAGYWWLAVLPGATLIAAVKLFDVLGEQMKRLLIPKTTQE